MPAELDVIGPVPLSAADAIDAVEGTHEGRSLAISFDLHPSGLTTS
jgi:hypothetical protein